MYVLQGGGGRGCCRHWLIRLVNAKAFMKEGEGNKTEKATYVHIVTGHGCEAEGHSSSKARNEGRSRGPKWRQECM